MYVLVYICIVLCMCTSVYQYVCIFVFVWVHVCLVVCSAIRTYLVRSWPSNGRLGLVFVEDPTQWRFENWSIGWTGDSYMFAQWRPNGDSNLKPHHFKWVFALVPFSLLTVISIVYILLVLLRETICFILSVWWPVSFLETSEIVPLIFLVDMRIFWHHFMY